MKFKLNLKFFESKKVFRKEESKISPGIYWKALLVISMVLVLCAFAFGFILYQQTQADFNLEQQNNFPKNDKIKKDRLDKVLEYFSSREKKSQGIISSPSPITDPSI